MINLSYVALRQESPYRGPLRGLFRRWRGVVLTAKELPDRAHVKSSPPAEERDGSIHATRPVTILFVSCLHRRGALIHASPQGHFVALVQEHLSVCGIVLALPSQVHAAMIAVDGWLYVEGSPLARSRRAAHTADYR
jgi:hypothetical protein